LFISLALASVCISTEASSAPPEFDELVGKRVLVLNPIYIRVTNEDPETVYDENEGVYYAVNNGTSLKPMIRRFKTFDRSKDQYGALENEEVEITDADWKTDEATITVKSLDGAKLRNVRVRFVFSTPQKFWWLFSQAFGEKAKYNFSLASGSLQYSDKAVTVSLMPSDFGIGLKIQNKLTLPITVNWLSGSFVNIAGEAQGIIHSGVKLINKEDYQKPTLIPPSASITDVVVPANSVEWTGKDWKYSPLFPMDSVSAKALNGKSVRIFLPLKISGKDHPLDLALKVTVE
jgi:hypothetical protein